MVEYTILSKKTPYGDEDFRSRLEARWAVFLDCLGVDYKYEPEYFEVDTGRGPVWYKPDFYLSSLKKYLSIKPFKPSENDIIKDVGWTNDIGNIVILFDLNPPNNKTESGYLLHTEKRSGMAMLESQTWWVECPRCNHIDLVTEGLPEWGCFSEKELDTLKGEKDFESPGPYKIFTHSRRMLTAYRVAKKIKFPRKDRVKPLPIQASVLR